MVAPSTQHSTHPRDQHCVWMDAGLLAYRLCNRGFDCEHCPLHAALHDAGQLNNLGSGAAQTGTAPTMCFPDDCLYAPTHTWVRFIRPERARAGIDGFAASLLGKIRRVRTPDDRSGRLICTLELDDGVLPITAPLPAKLCNWNEALADDPSLVITDPYGAGWICELVIPSRAAASHLMNGQDALRRAHFDDRRFRRRVALELLTDTVTQPETGPDLRRSLGGVRYNSLIRELIG